MREPAGTLSSQGDRRPSLPRPEGEKRGFPDEVASVLRRASSLEWGAAGLANKKDPSYLMGAALTSDSHRPGLGQRYARPGR